MGSRRATTGTANLTRCSGCRIHVPLFWEEGALSFHVMLCKHTQLGKRHRSERPGEKLGDVETQSLPTQESGPLHRHQSPLAARRSTALEPPELMTRLASSPSSFSPRLLLCQASGAPSLAPSSAPEAVASIPSPLLSAVPRGALP